VDVALLNAAIAPQSFGWLEQAVAGEAPDELRGNVLDGHSTIEILALELPQLLAPVSHRYLIGEKIEAELAPRELAANASKVQIAQHVSDDELEKLVFVCPIAEELQNASRHLIFASIGAAENSAHQVQRILDQPHETDAPAARSSDQG